MIISNVNVLVAGYDKAIDFYVNKLGFTLLCDVPVTANSRCEFLEQPREEIYATVVIFRDGEGNKWDLLQPKNN
jgi:catechol 2,3-dioxygenase-like lactoylglutathione lyase family enzyme